MATVVFIVLGSVLGIILLLGILPFAFRVKGGAHEGSLSGSIRVSWAFGLVSVQMASRGSLEWFVLGLRIAQQVRSPSSVEGDRTAAAESERPSARTGAVPWLRRLMAFRGHRDHLVGMLSRLAATVRLDLVLSGTVGTGDPANDAWLLMALRAAEELPGVRLLIDVDWLEQQVDVDMEASARVSLFHTMAVAAWLLASRPNRTALRAIA